MSKIKVLFLAANPLNTVWLKLDQEIRMVTEKLRISDNRDFIEFIPALAVTPDDLLQALNRHKPHIVHFSGHGAPLGEIILLNNDGAPKPIAIEIISELFKTIKDNIRVVIFNACHTMIQAQTMATVIDCAIGMDDEIEDQAAIIFASMFYSAIGYSRSIQDAFDQAKLALHIEGFSTGAKPKLFARSGLEPSLIFLTACSECPAKAETMSIELKINRNFSEYTLKDQDTILRAIRELLGVDKDLKIIQVKPGSVKLLIQVPVENVEKLLLLVNSGQLAKYDVVSAEIQNVSGFLELAAKLAVVVKDESPVAALVGQASVKELSDTDWINALKQKDSEALSKLWELLYKWAFAKISNPDIAQDIAVSTFSKIIKRGLQQFNFRTSFLSYCRVILNREFWRLQRRSEFVVAWDNQLVEEQTLSSVDSDSLLKMTQNCLERLSAQQRSIIQLLYFEDHSATEVAEQLGMSRSQVYNLASHARSRLRDCLQEQGFTSFEDISQSEE